MLDLPPGFWYASVDSTMAEARRLIDAGQIAGTAFVVAQQQTAGRGTRGRQWASPAESGIYLSIVHLPAAGETLAATPLYTLAAGVACVETLALITGLQIALKPINDLYIQGRKLGGILVESDIHQAGMTSLITGIGINTHQAPRVLDRPVISPVSLEELMPEQVFQDLSTDQLIETLVAKVCFWYGLLFAGQHGQVERAWERYRLREDEYPISMPSV